MFIASSLVAATHQRRRRNAAAAPMARSKVHQPRASDNCGGRAVIEDNLNHMPTRGRPPGLRRSATRPSWHSTQVLATHAVDERLKLTVDAASCPRSDLRDAGMRRVRARRSIAPATRTSSAAAWRRSHRPSMPLLRPLPCAVEPRSVAQSGKPSPNHAIQADSSTVIIGDVEDHCWSFSFRPAGKTT